MEFVSSQVIYFVLKTNESPLKEAVTQSLHFRCVIFVNAFAKHRGGHSPPSIWNFK